MSLFEMERTAGVSSFMKTPGDTYQCKSCGKVWPLSSVAVDGKCPSRNCKAPMEASVKTAKKYLRVFRMKDGTYEIEREPETSFKTEMDAIHAIEEGGPDSYNGTVDFESLGNNDQTMHLMGMDTIVGSMWPDNMNKDKGTFDKSGENEEDKSNFNKVVNKNIIPNEETLTTKVSLDKLKDEDKPKKADTLSEAPTAPTYRQVMSSSTYGPGERVTILEFPGMENFAGQKGTIEEMGTSMGYWVVRLDSGNRTMEVPDGALESESRR